jgi:deoxyribodipyrimidine photolyase
VGPPSSKNHSSRWTTSSGEDQHETASEVFPPEAAEQFDLKAQRIAESLKLALFYRPDAIRIAPPPGAA